MTVCIAAIYDHSSVVGASDRLLTAGDVQFEPFASKVRSLTNSIVAMTAGDADLNAEILDFVAADVLAEIDIDPSYWLRVAWVVERYRHHWSELQRRKAEREILKPLGLNTDRFLFEQASMGEKSVQDITNAQIGTRLASVSCIIAGSTTPALTSMPSVTATRSLQMRSALLPSAPVRDKLSYS